MTGGFLLCGITANKVPYVFSKVVDCPVQRLVLYGAYITTLCITVTGEHTDTRTFVWTP